MYIKAEESLKYLLIFWGKCILKILYNIKYTLHMILDNLKRESGREETIPWTTVISLLPFHTIQILWLDFVTSRWLTSQCEMSETELSLSLHPSSLQTHEHCQEWRFCLHRNMRTFTTRWLCRSKCRRRLCRNAREKACACTIESMFVIFWREIDFTSVNTCSLYCWRFILRLKECCICSVEICNP